MKDVSRTLRRGREKLRELVIGLRIAYLRMIWRHDVHPTARISYAAFLDKTKPQNIVIGAYSIVTRGAVILSHDFTQPASEKKTRIGRSCLIGVNAIVLPGVVVGDNVVVGAGSVVTRDVEPNRLIVGNPAKPIRVIRTGNYGKILDEKPIF